MLFLGSNLFCLFIYTYFLICAGLPAIIVGVTLATSFNNYVADNHCWLNVQTNIIWAFVGPVLFILAVSAKAFLAGLIPASWFEESTAESAVPALLQLNACSLAFLVVFELGIFVKLHT